MGVSFHTDSFREYAKFYKSDKLDFDSGLLFDYKHISNAAFSGKT